MSLKCGIWPLNDVVQANAAQDERFYEFLDTATLSAEIYELKAGQTDLQQPHDLDELYYIVSGTAQFFCDGKSRAVQPGDTIFVAAHIEHRFHDIIEDLKLLVVFSKKEPNS